MDTGFQVNDRLLTQLYYYLLSVLLHARIHPLPPQTRAVLDIAAITAAMAVGNTNYAFDGPPEPKGSWKSASYTTLGIACIVATIRAFLFTSAIVYDLIKRNS